ncbi:hypothetical protein L208DRAFT_324488 [Tricholoma matsutake]|nr:hypothetical protein L208DRAFT_324488 [Tricholoma matsutake 945]
MGFFDDVLSIRSHPLLPHLPSRRKVEHDVSFDFTTCNLQQKMPLISPPRFLAPAVPLPSELVFSIIEFACFDGFKLDESLLRHCALVCRAWSYPSQKLLFGRVTLRTRTAYVSFRAAVIRSTKRGRMLGDAVIRLKAILDHNHRDGLSQHSFGDAFTMCPNLHELNLALYGCAAPGEDKLGVPNIERMRRPAPTFDDHTLLLLKSGPKITALHFSNWSENQYSFTQLLTVWPTLKSLVISGTTPHTPSSIAEPLACSLEQLRMNFQTSPSIDFMNWLLHNSSTTLRVLEFDREPSAHFLDYLVDAHGSGLHSLSIPSCLSHHHALAVQKCPQLREFCIENLTTCIKIYRKIFGTLEHIALGLDRNTILQPIIETVRSSDTLKVVTVNVWHGGDQHPQYSTLKVACAYRGVELRITKDIQVFRLMMRGDPQARTSSLLASFLEGTLPNTMARLHTYPSSHCFV